MFSKRLALVIVLLLLVSGLAAWALTAWDPLNQIVTIDGSGMHFKGGGRVDGAFINYLQRGPQPGNATAGWVVADDPYGTLRYIHEDWRLPAYSPPVFENPLRGLFTGGLVFPNPARLLGWLLFGWWTQNAAAVNCNAAGGACFWIGGTGNFSSTAHWSNTSGGAACTCVPTTTSTITFDASSGTGTATQDNAAFTSAAVTMTSSTVSVDGSTNTWNVGGSWSDANSHFVYTTSTVVFTATATVNSGSSVQHWYNFTVNVSVTVTFASAIMAGNVVTINGTITGASMSLVMFGGTTPLVLGGSSSITGIALVEYRNQSSTSETIAAGTYPGLTIDPATGSTHTATAGGGITATSLTLWQRTANNTIDSILAMGTNTLTISGAVSIGNGANNIGTLTFTTTGGGSVGSLILNAGGTLTMASGTLTMNGNLNLSAGTINYGTSVVVFAASATLTAPAWTSQRSLYDLTVNLGVTVTIAVGQVSIGISDVLTINGTVAFGAEALTLFNDTGTSAPLVLGGSAAMTGTAGSAELEFFDHAGTLTTIPSFNYGNVFWKIGPSVTVAGLGYEYRFAGNMTVFAVKFNIRASDPFFMNTQTFNFTVTATGATQGISSLVALVSPPAYGIIATSGTWSFSSGITMANTGDANFFLQLGSVGWTFTNVGSSGFIWSLAAVTTTSNWNVGTSTVTFSITGGAAFRFTAGAVNNFNNVTFQNAGSGLRYYAYTNDTTNPLLASGTLTVSDASTTTVFDTVNTAGSAIGVTVGAVSITTGGSFKANTSVVTVNGNVNIGAATAYLTMGSSSWTVAGTWSNSTTSASWSSGTSTVTMGGTYSVAPGTTLTFNHSLITQGINEFYNLGLNPTITGTPGRVGFPLQGTSGDLITLHNITVQATASGSNAAYFDLGNSSGITFSITGGVTGLANGQVVLDTTSITVTGNWDFNTSGNANTGHWGQSSSVVMNGTAQNAFCAAQGQHASFNNLTINIGDTVTTNGGTCQIDGVLTVNGTLKSAAALQRVILSSASLGGTATPLVLGGSGDIHLLGMTEYLNCNNPAPGVVMVTSTQYWYLNLVGCNSHSFKLAGNVTSFNSGVDNQSAFLFSGYTVSDVPTFYTQGFSMTFPGVMWVGDLNIGGVAHLQGSTITAGGLDAISGTIYLEQATLNLSIPVGDAANVCSGVVGGSGQIIQALTTEYSGVIHGGTAIVNAGGYCVSMNNHVGNPQAIYAEGMTITIKHVEVKDAVDFIQFGNSTWNISGNIASVSNSVSWDAGSTALVYLNGSSTQTITLNGMAIGTVHVSGGEKDFAQNLTTDTLTQDDPNMPNPSIVMTNGVTWTLTPSSNIIGFAGSHLYIRPSNTSTWSLTALGPTTASYVDVSWSNAAAGSTINACTGSTDSGNNVNWNFCGNAQVAPVGTGPAFDCTTQYTVMRYEVVCLTTGGPYQTPKWYINGKLVSTAASLDYTLTDFQIETVVIQVLLTVGNGANPQPLATGHSYTLDYRINAFIWVVVILPFLIIGAAVAAVTKKRPNKQTVVIMRPRSSGPPMGRPPNGGM